MPNLSRLAAKYGTDKLNHGYIPVYEQYLPKTCRTLIEIGVANGASAQMWNDFYGEENVCLHLVDLFINPEFVSERWCINRNFVPHKGSQSDIEFLSTIKAQAEVITDDGSHNAYDMLASFKHLFVNNMQSGGVYFMEDCHCNLDKFYYGRGVNDFKDTPLYMFREYLRNGKIENFMFRKEEAEVFESLIKSVHIEAEGKIIVITKK